MEAMKGHPLLELNPTPFKTKPNKHISHQTTNQILDSVTTLNDNVTQTLPFEIYDEAIYSFALIPEYHDPYLFQINAQNVIRGPDEPAISTTFNPTPKIHHGTYRKKYIPKIVQHNSQNIFRLFFIELKKLTTFNPN